MVRQLRCLEPLAVSLISGSRSVAPFGLEGGAPGACWDASASTVATVAVVGPVAVADAGASCCCCCACTTGAAGAGAGASSGGGPPPSPAPAGVALIAYVVGRVCVGVIRSIGRTVCVCGNVPRCAPLSVLRSGIADLKGCALSDGAVTRPFVPF